MNFVAIVTIGPDSAWFDSKVGKLRGADTELLDQSASF